ncbi:MAG: U32 family peptidase [Bacteroidales bacterium]
MQPIELLAPAKDAETGILAINHGADAVYIGASGFSARAAAGCTVEDIARLIQYARRFRAKVYVALNTLLFDQEFDEVIALIQALYQEGADALIIQDPGLLECNLPPIALHASTQMHNHSAEKIAFLASVGISRVVLARELSLSEIGAIHSEHPAIELECFVHGSLCVSYSGQCYMSQAIVQRSANRGVCAQPCRSAYNLIDSRGDILVRNRHLLSIKDLNRSAALAELIDAGVCSFKIEGRLKDAAYVKNITAWYRTRLDEILEGKSGFRKASAGTTTRFFTPDPERTFNRGYTDYFLHKREQCGTPATQKSVGKPLGTVVRKRGRELMVDTPLLVSNGDGICYIDASGQLDGFLVNRTEGFWILPGKAVDIAVGTALYRNHDHRFYRELSGETARRTLALQMRLYSADESCWLEATDERGFSATVGSEIPFSPARNSALAKRQIEEQLEKLGDTPFHVQGICIDCPELPFLPISVLNRMRREVTEILMAKGLKTGNLSDVTPLNDSWKSDPATNDPSGTDGTSSLYPEKILTFEGNVLNSKAEQFYRKHGVESIEPGFEVQEAYIGKRVMTTRHCLRFEFGKCPRYQSGSAFENEPLFLQNGTATYRLHFDCKRCVMEIYIETL